MDLVGVLKNIMFNIKSYIPKVDIQGKECGNYVEILRRIDRSEKK